MATVFPKKRLQDNEILDIDDTNNAFRDMSQEAGSALGEHNWKKDAFDAAHLDPAEVIVATSTFHESDYSSPSVNLYDGVLPIPETSYIVGAARSWDEIPNMAVDITTGNSLLWIIASLQYTNLTAFTGKESCVEFCLALNGAPIPESITGSTDLSNDPNAHGALDSRAPVVLDTLIPVSPGNHRITVFVRTQNNVDWFFFSALYDDTVDNRELIVLEMK